MTHHGSVTDSLNIHRAHAYEFADAAARSAATGYAANAIGRWALQLDDNSIWMLTDNDPMTWEEVAASTSYSNEEAQDAVGTILVDSTSINFTYDDGTPSITAVAIFGTSAGTVAEGDHLHDSRYYTEAEVDALIAGAGGYTDEQAQDAIGAMVIDTNSIDVTYTDATPELKFDIKDEYLMDWLGALVTDSTNIDTTYNDGANTYALDLTTAAKTFSINFIIDGGGSAITTGVKGDIVNDVNATVVAWTALGDQSGSIVVDIWQDTYANFPPVVGDSITGAEKPTISAATKGQDTSLNSGSGWDLVAGSILRFNVDSITSLTRCTISLKCVRD